MRFLTVIFDGNGHTHMLVSKAPDLRRREIAADTGSASIVWCQMTAKFSAAVVVARVTSKLAMPKNANGSYNISPELIVRSIHWEIYIRPMLEFIANYPRRAIRRTMRYFSGRRYFS